MAGFAGAAADAFALMDKFESKLEEFGGNLKKSAVELAKDWRNDKALRVLDAISFAIPCNERIFRCNDIFFQSEQGIIYLVGGVWSNP